jgi:hypothetical protein
MKKEPMEINELENVSERTINRAIKVSQLEVIAEAEALLGFKRRDAGLLLAALKELDIQPLNAEQVATYKKSRQHKRIERSGRWDRPDTRITQTWRAVKLSDFSGDIPVAILSKAVNIKKAVPDVEFEVESLVENRRKVVKRLPDPFLVAILNGRRVYIDVWDEPEFESKLYA